MCLSFFQKFWLYFKLITINSNKLLLTKTVDANQAEGEIYEHCKLFTIRCTRFYHHLVFKKKSQQQTNFLKIAEKIRIGI